MVRTLRRFSLNMNLTKWLSKCEGSLLKGKKKNDSYIVINDERRKLIKHGKEHKECNMEGDTRNMKFQIDTGSK